MAEGNGLMALEADIYEYPSYTKTAAEIAESVVLSEERLLELAEARLIPHYRIDGTIVRFKLADVKRWIANRLMEVVEGQTLPIQVIQRHINPAMIDVTQMPAMLSEFGPLLTPIQVHNFATGPGVYFLCDDTLCYYVGQSIEPFSRIGTHLAERKTGPWDRAFIFPCRQDQLLDLEAAFIRMLCPNYNTRGHGEPSSFDVQILSRHRARVTQVKGSTGGETCQG